MDSRKREASLLQVFLVLGVLVAVFILGIQQAGVSGHVPLIIGSVAAMIVAMVSLGYKFEDIEQGAIKTLGAMVPAIFTLLAVGMMVAMWIASGLIPLIMYYGVDWLSPQFFLISTFILCAIISSFTGSSWTTGATIGLALLGVGQALGISTPMIVGAIISGAYTGDKISPLSDNTNLSAGMSEVALFRHVRHSLYTTVPAFLLTAIIFLSIGLWGDVSLIDTAPIKESLRMAIDEKFTLSLVTLTAPLVLFGLVYFKVPSFLALMGSALYAGFLAVVYQGMDMTQFFTYMTSGYTLESSHEMVGELFNRGGLLSMMDTIGLILCAALFGGIMDSTGMIRTLSNSIVKMLKSRGSIFLGTASSAIMFNGLLGDQYLSVIMTASMFKDIFKMHNLDALNLARVTGDSAVTTSVFFPWNTCGAYFIGVLNIAPWTYIPFCFFNLISVFLTVLYGYFNWFVKPLEKEVDLLHAELEE